MIRLLGRLKQKYIIKIEDGKSIKRNRKEYKRIGKEHRGKEV